MLGGMFSVLTLGLIPHYYTVNEDYEIKIIEKSSKKVRNISFKNNYGVLSASWLWPFPSSEGMARGRELNRMEKNKAHYLVKRIVIWVIVFMGRV